MQQTPPIPEGCQWAIFLRNHDELTLEMVTSKERDYMYTTYASDPRARINLGIRRRLAPLMENNIDTIKLMNSLLLSMPGSPIIYYGDELGMGDNVYIGDRNGVRTPMQWNPDRNAGFSRAGPQRLYLPPVMDAIYGYLSVNVESQLRDPSSLLNWMRRMLAVRKASRAFGRGTLSFLKPGNRKVLAYLREHEDDVILCVCNLSRSAQPVELNLARYKGRVPVELLGRTPFPPIGELPYLLTIPAHGFYWFKLDKEVPVPSWHTEYLAMEDTPVMVLFDGWRSFFKEIVVPWRTGLAAKTRVQLEEQVLPRFIEAQRWYAAKGEPINKATLMDHVPWKVDGDSWLITLVDVGQGPDGCGYFMPLAKAWEEVDEERTKAMTGSALARIRQQAQMGVMADAFSDAAFCRAIVRAMGKNEEIPTPQGKLQFRATSAYQDIVQNKLEALPVSKPQNQSSNTIVSMDETVFLKGYRFIRPGVNLEYEMGRYLTEVAKFPHCVPILGVVEHLKANGEVRTLAIAQAYVNNQGDGWSQTLNYLERYLETSRSGTTTPPDNVHGAYLELVATLGQRTAEMHQAFSMNTGDPLFDPEPLTKADLDIYRERMQHDADAALGLLGQHIGQLAEEDRALAQVLLDATPALMLKIAEHVPPPTGALKIRCHGDYHLAQVLVTRNDFVIIDFEGEPGRPMDERRAKQVPWLDVAGMLRSFSYARLSALRKVATRDEETMALAPLAQAWETQTRAAFLMGYGLGPTEQVVRATDPADLICEHGKLLSLFELDKALYELRYELNNRPEWVSIPIQGILNLVTLAGVDHAS